MDDKAFPTPRLGSFSSRPRVPEPRPAFARTGPQSNAIFRQQDEGPPGLHQNGGTLPRPRRLQGTGGIRLMNI